MNAVLRQITVEQGELISTLALQAAIAVILWNRYHGVAEHLNTDDDR